jgi:hypothetical protein
VLPLSFRLVVLDNDLLIKKSLNILIQNGVLPLPLAEPRSLEAEDQEDQRNDS